MNEIVVIEEREEVREQLRKNQAKKNIESLNNSATGFAINQFYQVNRDIQKKAIENISDGKFDEYIVSLMSYDCMYYEQLLVNIGKEFKLSAYGILMNDVDNTEAIAQLIYITKKRIDVLMSKPVLNLYHQEVNGSDIEKDSMKLILSVIAVAIEETLNAIVECIRHILTSSKVMDKESIATEYESFYLGGLQFILSEIIEIAFDYKKDEPWYEGEMDSYTMCENIVFCIGSPVNDPLRIYFQEVNMYAAPI